MKLFYSWTVMQFINMVNLKSGEMRNEKGILLIAKFENTDNYIDLIKKVEHYGIFNKIQFVDLYDWTDKYRLPYIASKKILNHIKENVEEDIDELIVPGFWTDALRLCYAIRLGYGDIPISLIEEGITFPTTQNIFYGVGKLKRILFGGMNYKRYLSQIKNIYTYEKPYEEELEKYKLHILNKIDINNQLCYELLQHNSVDNRSYVESFDCLFMDSNFSIENLDKKIKHYDDIFDILQSTGFRISVRLHPSGPNRRLLFEKLHLSIDTKKRTIEELAVSGNWDNKLIISLYSSGALNMHRIFGLNVKVIYLYKISGKIEGINSESNIRFGENVFVPSSIEEYVQIVKNLAQHR